MIPRVHISAPRAHSTARPFGLRERPLAFARLYAEHPLLGVTWAAKKAGYSDKGKAAHVRACELMRDPRVLMAVLYFGAQAFSEAQGYARHRLDLLAVGPGWLSDNDRMQLRRVVSHLERIERAAVCLESVLARAGGAVPRSVAPPGVDSTPSKTPV